MLIAKFELGMIVVTPRVLDCVSEQDQMIALNRHANSDWGNVSKNDAISNENGVIHGGRIFSSYTTESGKLFYIITEGDRSATTLLMPEEL